MPLFARSTHRKNARSRIAAAASAVIGGLILSSVAVVATTQSADATVDSAPCLASPAWSYTWDGAAGVATVTAAGGTEGQLVCAPLYVRATTWNYDTPLQNATPSWPQTKSGTNDYTIDTVGTHTIVAPGTLCGQDDIYATFDVKGFGALAIGNVLTGPGKPYEPTFLHNVIKTGSGGSTWHTDSPASCPATVDIEKTASVASTEAEESFTYSLAASTLGAAGAVNPVVTDTLPIDLSLNGTPTIPSGWTYTPSTEPDGRQTVTFTLAGTLVSTAPATFVVPVTVDSSPTVTSLENTARVCASNTAPLCDTDTVTTPIKSISMIVDAVCTNDVPYLHYLITTTNVDLVANPQVKMEWAPKTGPIEDWATSYLTSAPVLDGYLIWPGAAVDANGNATAWPGWSQVNGEWVYDATAPGANLRDHPRITASINPTTSVTVSYPDQASGCADPETDVAALDIVKDTEADFLAAGDGFDYSITVTNPGSLAAKDVVVTDTLQPQLALTAVPTAAGWSCSGPVATAGATFTCTKSSPLLTTDTSVITVPVAVIDTLVVESTITVPNTAKVCASNVNIVSATAVNGCPTSTVSVKIVPDLVVLAPAGLEILKTASVKATTPGGSYSYTLLVGNTDFGDTLDVVVTDTLDPRLKLAKVPSGTDWDCVVTDNGTNGYGASFECALQVPLVNGTPKSILVNVLVDAGADLAVSKTISNTAVVCASNVLGCLQSSVSVSLADDQLTTLPFTGVEAVSIAAIALGALGLGLGLVLLGLTRRSRKQTR